MLVMLQPPNALSPMLITLLGMIILVREVQHQNALSPMVVTQLGMVTLVRELQP